MTASYIHAYLTSKQRSSAEVRLYTYVDVDMLVITYKVNLERHAKLLFCTWQCPISRVLLYDYMAMQDGMSCLFQKTTCKCISIVTILKFAPAMMNSPYMFVI